MDRLRNTDILSKNSRYGERSPDPDSQPSEITDTKRGFFKQLMKKIGLKKNNTKRGIKRKFRKISLDWIDRMRIWIPGGGLMCG